jgi:hypothetical protein
MPWLAPWISFISIFSSIEDLYDIRNIVLVPSLPATLISKLIITKERQTSPEHADITSNQFKFHSTICMYIQPMEETVQVLLIPVK